MKLVFKIDRFITWCYINGSTPRQVQNLLEKHDWGKYDGMSYEEVKKQEYAVMREWFEPKQEETK